jgi:hypothetical protein
MFGNSLCSYPYLQLAKNIILKIFFLLQNQENRRAEQVWGVCGRGLLAPVGWGRWWGQEDEHGINNVYT